MQVDTGLLGGLPIFGDGLVDVCLMDDFGDQLRARFDQGRVRCRQFRPVYGIGGGIFDEQRQ